MATLFKPLLCALLMVISLNIAAQAPIKKFVDKTGSEKIKKHLLKVSRGDNGNKDGHGRFPFLTSMPDTIALITYYIYDEGFSRSNPAYIYTYNLTGEGGNYFANQLHNESIKKLKATFKARGIVLLTPDEYLNTPEKKNFYYKEFQPKLSKLGKFLSGLESGGAEVAVCADNYRGFDEAAAEDHIRSVSLGDELARKLGVDAVMSVAIQLGYDGKKVSLSQVKTTINGPNPVPRQDKKYIGAAGAGYQEGLVYFAGYYYFKPVVIAKLKKKGTVAEENYEGFGDLLACYAEAAIERMQNVVNKNNK